MTRMARGRPPAEPILVQRQEELDELCARCRKERRFAFDTEFVMEDRYATEICLIQIATAQSVALIDPLGPLKLTGIWELVCDPRTETIVHAGQEDLALCFRHAGEVPRNVFDVQIAAGLIGLDYPISLQKLVQATLHVRLHKAKTLTDWRKRPLTESQVRYAAEDVLHLPAVRDRLAAKLSKLERLDWAEEEFREFEEARLYHRVEEDQLRRIKGSGSLDGKRLAVLREVLAWREQLAVTRNRPARTVLKDHVMMEVARQGLSTFAEIRDLRGLNLGDREVHALARAVHDASKLPPERWPAVAPREIESAGETVLVTLLTAVLRNYASSHDLAYGLLATQQSIRELVRRFTVEGTVGDSDVEILQGWRGRTVGKMLRDVLSGKSALRVDRAGGQPVIEVYTSPRN
jgi:ribonuclease D